MKRCKLKGGHYAPPHETLVMKMYAERYFAGIDVGSTTTKAVVITSKRALLGKAVVPTGISAGRAVDKALAQALEEASIERGSIRRLVATGYGRNLVNFADERITEITCHARGAFEKLQSELTLIDIGGQDCKAIAIGSQGRVKSFQMNDRCAAGTGRFLEVLARVLETDVENLSAMALAATRRVNINNMCTVFAESEVVSFIAQETPPEDIACGLCWSVAERVGGMAKKVGLGDDIFISGGVAYNSAIVTALGKQLGRTVQVIEEPQLNGAYGAAIIAGERMRLDDV